MISRLIFEHHLSRFYTLSHIIEKAMLDTDDDKMAKPAIRALLNEWSDWCSTLEFLFPSRAVHSQMQRLFETGGRGAVMEDSTADVVRRFEKTNELLKRLALIHDMEE